MPQNITDKDILNDMLMTEKYVSNSYENSVLESANPQLRQALQHIQKEEQQHAEQVFNAMQQRGWYNPQNS
ncbi:Coat F domain-containing protein [Candidatus Frackibacter sp. WG12]|uniref:spore coat protein n=1 Tax=unclassified Candidatus Frackibacter TaxID=2648818 RepID=UPI0007994E24|nr:MULTISPECIES: spore coat protein [unclassified Candidatus Frackibacter]KXS37738.1 MAG: hypothetical protein AWU54_2271 [Candidatus Frackibacter sp. T328-2]SDC41017.1 Coat F domain-containing protein [Candidatus Frackibacter sp. WG11]SEM59867.1 Coat F domain-containing protein [Candidatus Frackibacter sp. WG12]SFL62216.1 Coat F domain-containing protein [Candidatus Frackibacter sp. WG13]